MKNHLAWLKYSYWIGAIADFAVGVAMVFPELFLKIYRINNYSVDPPFRVAMLLAASLMFGWTILLIWAERKPAKRKGVLPITVAVILGLAGSEAYAVAGGFIAFSEMIITWLVQLCLIILFLFSYLNASRKD
jgi:hypothetical protein